MKLCWALPSKRPGGSAITLLRCAMQDREAISGAIVRKNYAVPATHRRPRSCWGGWLLRQSYDAAHFDEFESAELGIVPTWTRFLPHLHPNRWRRRRPVPAHQLSAFTCQEQKYGSYVGVNAATGVRPRCSGRVGRGNEITNLLTAILRYATLLPYSLPKACQSL